MGPLTALLERSRPVSLFAVPHPVLFSLRSSLCVLCASVVVFFVFFVPFVSFVMSPLRIAAGSDAVKTLDDSMLLGAHLSIAGGLCEALRAARRYRFAALALFLRNHRQWAAPPLSEEAAEEFRALRRKLGVGPVAAHGSYLSNLAGSPAVRRKSVDSLAEDRRRCGRLGIEYLVIHPGSHADAAEGVRLIAEGLREVLGVSGEAATMILLETTAGAGHSIGGRFEELAEVLARAEGSAQADNLSAAANDRPRLQPGYSAAPPPNPLPAPRGGGKGRGAPETPAEAGACHTSVAGQRPLPVHGRLGVCLDTCHVFAAGYDLRTPRAYAETMALFDAVIGLSRLRAVHLNDSLGRLGSRLDRHAHIGKGRIGLEGFGNLVRDPRLAGVPLILETPKGKDRRGRDWDRLNADAIRRLARAASRARSVAAEPESGQG
jgi:deoxyribonuclease IV